MPPDPKVPHVTPPVPHAITPSHPKVPHVLPQPQIIAPRRTPCNPMGQQRCHELEESKRQLPALVPPLPSRWEPLANGKRLSSRAGSGSLSRRLSLPEDERSGGSRWRRRERLPAAIPRLEAAAAAAALREGRGAEVWGGAFPWGRYRPPHRRPIGAGVLPGGAAPRSAPIAARLPG